MTTTRALLALLITSIDTDEKLCRDQSTILTEIRAMNEVVNEIKDGVATLTQNAADLQQRVDTLQETVAGAFAALTALINAGSPDAASLIEIRDALAANNAALAATAQDVADTPVPNPADLVVP